MRLCIGTMGFQLGSNAGQLPCLLLSKEFQ